MDDSSKDLEKKNWTEDDAEVTKVGFTVSQEILDMVEEEDFRPILIQMSGSEAGCVHSIDKETTLGRGNHCTLSFHDVTLSRKHARIFQEGDAIIFEDLQSLNGSLVNLRLVQRKHLEHGDRLQLGTGVRFQFQYVSEQEKQVLVRLYEASVRDGLTDVFNRRYLEEHLGPEISHAVRHKRPLCLILFDVDHFKQVNDTYGHLAGDEVLKVLADVVTSTIRTEDFLARYGGEEFAILVRDVPLSSAVCLAHRVRKSIESTEVKFNDHLLQVTVSLGVTSLDYCSKPDVTTLFASADRQMYRAKAEGRNRVAVVSDDENWAEGV